MLTMEEFCNSYFVDRKGTDSVKWDSLNDTFGEENLIPLWVADMDFKLPEKVIKVMQKRVEHGVFGYSIPSKGYYSSFIKWQERRHSIHVEQNWIRFSTGVVNSFNYMIQCFSEPKDSVIVLAPVYYPFYDAVTQNNRELVTANLIPKQSSYEIDLADFEKKIVAHDIKLFLHCSPHNPVGRIWSEQELTQLFDICLKHDVTIISDEIHQDFIREGEQFIGALRLSKRYYPNLIVLTSASKTFNLASLLHSHIIIPDELLLEKYDAYALKVINNPPSLMGMIATESCYEYGEEWFDSLLHVIEFNYQLVKKIVSDALPMAQVKDKQATYLVWLDLSAYVSGEEMKEYVQEKARLAIDFGEWFGSESGSYIRINLATSPKIIETAMRKLVKVVNEK